MVLKIIWYFNQCTDISKISVALTMVSVFIFGDLKVCMRKELILLLHLIIRLRVKFDGSCLKQGKITYTHRKPVDIYIVYEISKTLNISSYLTLGNS